MEEIAADIDITPVKRPSKGLKKAEINILRELKRREEKYESPDNVSTVAVATGQLCGQSSKELRMKQAKKYEKSKITSTTRR